MSAGYRAWPAALLTGAALTAACVVVGEQVIQTNADGCRGSVGWFTATPVGGAAGPAIALFDAKAVPTKSGIGRVSTIEPVGQASDEQPSTERVISGCLDVDRIEIPMPVPAPDGRA